MASSSQTIVPIFDENRSFIGVWTLDPHPSEHAIKAQLDDLGEPTWMALKNNKPRRVRNRSTDVGRGIVFKNGVFLMIHGNPAPSESLSAGKGITFTCFFKDGFSRLQREGGTPKGAWQAPDDRFDLPIRGRAGRLTGMWVADPEHENLQARLEMALVAAEAPVETFAAFTEGRYRMVPNRAESGGGAFLMLGDTPAPTEGEAPPDEAPEKPWWQFWR